MIENPTTYVERERERLIATRGELVQERTRITAEIDMQLSDVERQLNAIEAYEAALAGPRHNKAQPKGNRRRAMREVVLKALQATPIGLKKREVSAAVGVDGDASGEMAVSNALNALKRDGRVQRDAGGRWRAAESVRDAA
jgi:hypothetical protein